MIDLSIVSGLRALEIAGPSKIFQSEGPIPVYDHLSVLDDCSYPRPERWGGRPLIEGADFFYVSGRRLGKQFVGDATELNDIADGSYELILGSHVLEHFANPIKALRTWMRVLAPNGLILQVVPHGRMTFDKHRPITELDHLIADFRSGTTESDQTHHDEVRMLSTETHSNTWFAEAALHRGVHQHVFDTKSVLALFEHVGLVILGLRLIEPYNIVVLARNGRLPNDRPLSNAARRVALLESPFQER
jgi:SAM-dependent methyltransferase